MSENTRRDIETRTLIVRPQGVCQDTCRFLSDHGLAVQALPVMDIIPCIPDAPVIRNALATTDVIVATSSNVVRALHLHQGSWEASTPVFAVGQKTAGHLQKYFKRILVPENHNSEGILALLAEHSQFERVVILKGRGGRDKIERVLKARGKFVRSFALYKRIANNQIEPDSVRWQYVDQVVITSVELVQQLLSYSRPADNLRIRWVVLSDRIAHALSRAGYNNIVVTSGTSNQAILESLLQNRHT